MVRTDARYLHVGARGGLTVDADAQVLGIAPASATFFEKAIGSLPDPAQAKLARSLLARYAPEGPGIDASADRWRSWSSENKAYLFFSDTGGYRWYIDPLAKRRKLPTARLRGDARATVPAPVSRKSGTGRVFGDDDIIPNDNFVPDEATGFSGTLSAKVVQTRSDNWFVIKVVKVIGFSAKNKTRLNAKDLTAVWKDKYTNIRGVKGMPKLKAGDMVTVVAAQFERHLRATKVSKQARPGGEK